MSFIVGILTFFLIINCVVLILLVLVQLPKKDAGAGIAFGGGTADALFGAGSGNVLTKITKWAATVFFGLAVVLSLMQRVYHTRTTSIFEQKLQQSGTPQSIPVTPAQAPSAPVASPQTPATKPAAVAATNGLRIVTTSAEDTNVPVATPTAPAPATTPKK